MGKRVKIYDEESGELKEKRKFNGFENAVENDKDPVALTVRWSTDVPLEIRRKLTYRLVEKTNKGTGPNKMPVLIAEGEGLRFISNPMGPETEVYSGTVCLENEQDKTVEFVATNNYCLYPDIYINQKSEEQAVTEAPAVPSYREQKESLISAFGSAKGTRLVNTRQRNSLVSKTQIEVDIAKAVEQVVPMSLDMLGTAGLKPGVSYLPPYHLDAQTPREAYRFTDLLTEQEMTSLTTYAQVFVNANYHQIQDWRMNKTYSSFVLNQLDALPSLGEERRTRSAMLAYYHILFTFFTMKAVNFRQKKCPLPVEFPDRVKQRVRSEFMKQMPGQKFAYVPKEMKDKTLLYMCVVALMLTDFALELTEMEEDTDRRLRVYFEQLGCRITTMKSNKTASGSAQRATLHVPLEFPQLKGLKKKGT